MYKCVWQEYTIYVCGCFDASTDVSHDTLGVDLYRSNHEIQQAIVGVIIDSGNHMKATPRCVICISSKALDPHEKHGENRMRCARAIHLKRTSCVTVRWRAQGETSKKKTFGHDMMSRVNWGQLADHGIVDSMTNASQEHSGIYSVGPVGSIKDTQGANIPIRFGPFMGVQPVSWSFCCLILPCWLQWSKYLWYETTEWWRTIRSTDSDMGIKTPLDPMHTDRLMHTCLARCAWCSNKKPLIKYHDICCTCRYISNHRSYYVLPRICWRNSTMWLLDFIASLFDTVSH